MGYVYVIQAGNEDFYKIGVSDKEPRPRLKDASPIVNAIIDEYR